MGYILYSGSSSSLSELKNRRLFLAGLGGVVLSLVPCGPFLALLDPTLATLLQEEARDRERPLGGLAGRVSVCAAPSDSTCRQE